MKVKPRQSALTLMEMTVVISVIAMLTVFGLPAIRAFFNSFESRGAARSMISAALASARAIAAKEQHYAGIRFQNRYQENGEGCQYMIFIINDTEIGPGVAGNLGCRAVKGLEPIKLPDSVGVMEVVNSDDEIDGDDELTDKTTFSIIFSPSGKLVIHNLWVRSRGSEDDIFNTQINVANRTGMFVQDEITNDIEPSKNSFRIYDKDIFEKINPNRRWSDYLEDLEAIYINPYAGTMINR